MRNNLQLWVVLKVRLFTWKIIYLNWSLNGKISWSYGDCNGKFVLLLCYDGAAR